MPPAIGINLHDTELTFRGTNAAKLLAVKFLFQVLMPRLISRGERWARSTLKVPFAGERLIRHVGPFPYFCGGTSIEDCARKTRRLKERGIRSILDYSVEGLGREEDFDHTRDEVLRTLATHDTAFGVFKVTSLGDKRVLEKASAREPLEAQDRASLDRTVARVRQICGSASAAGLRVLIDAEESWIQTAIDDIALEMMQEFNRERAVVYNTLQFYRTDRLAHLSWLCDYARAHGFVTGLKLVRGAYMEAERKRAAQRGETSPIHATKGETDAAYDSAVAFCLEHLDSVSIVAGTHNDVSVGRLLEQMSLRDIAPADSRIEFSQLLGMSDNLSVALARNGYNVSKYVPYGAPSAVIPYLVRRAKENSSIAGQTAREIQLLDRELARRWPRLARFGSQIRRR